MGTNYDYHVDVCQHCKRSKQSFHIGKSSGGWTFTFQAFHSHETPFVLVNEDITDPVCSFSDWKKIFNLVPGEIRDEYGEVVSVKDFVELVEFKKTAKYNHAQTLRDAKSGNKEAQRLWGSGFLYESLAKHVLDEEGNSFTYGDFS